MSDVFMCTECNGFHEHILEWHAGSNRSGAISYRWTCGGCGVRFDNTWRLGRGWSGPIPIGKED